MSYAYALIRICDPYREPNVLAGIYFNEKDAGDALEEYYDYISQTRHCQESSLDIIKIPSSIGEPISNHVYILNSCTEICGQIYEYPEFVTDNLENLSIFVSNHPKKNRFEWFYVTLKPKTFYYHNMTITGFIKPTSQGL